MENLERIIERKMLKKIRKYSISVTEFSVIYENTRILLLTQRRLL